MAARALDEWNLYLSPEHPCHYLHGRRARIVVLDDNAPLDKTSFSWFSARGFRRSGSYLYRPACPGCRACQSLRVPVDEFRPDRSQRRALRRNADLTVTALTPRFDPEHYALFKRYIESRHRDGGMEDTSRNAYMSFLDSGWTDTIFHEFRAGRRLLAVAVADRLADGLSAVYTFYDPVETSRGLGNYAILTEIDLARRSGLSWLYLGYWVGGSEKMDYKNRFRPHEILTTEGWLRVGA
ncbi:MAG TPA: arginyltransferase [Gammaproteobacteria bacterium]|nr:arginyltransferase [Gammaproteobacteria bacterium]